MARRHGIQVEEIVRSLCIVDTVSHLVGSGGKLPARVVMTRCGSADVAVSHRTSKWQPLASAY